MERAKSAKPLSAIMILCLTGVLLSAVSLYEYVLISSGLSTGGTFCRIGQLFDCAPGILSPWSAFLGIPLGAYGLAFYLGLLLFGILARSEALVEPRIFADVSLVAALSAGILSVFLFFVSQLVVGALCPICMAMYAVNFALLAAAWLAGRTEKFFARLRFGVLSIASFPMVFVGAATGAGPKATALVRFSAICGLSMLFAVYLAPAFIYGSLLMRRAEDSHVLKNWAAQPQVRVAAELSGGLERDYLRGLPSAPIQIVEFSDFECPACRQVYVMLEEILREYEGKAALSFRNFPLDKACNPGVEREFHQNACYAAHFSRCAGEQGRYWEAVDYLFRMPEFDAEKDPEKIRQAIRRGAQVLDLDGQAVDECIQSGRHLGKIREDIEQGNKIGVEGTPAFWINGRLLEAPSRQAFKIIFDHILSEPQGK